MVNEIPATPEAYRQRLREWVDLTNSAVGTSFSIEDNQCAFATQSGIEIVLTTAPHVSALYVTAVIACLAPGDDRALAGLLSNNLFQRESYGGWFAFEPQTRAVCHQIRWDRFGFAEAEDFISLLSAFIQASEHVAHEFRTMNLNATEPAALDPYMLNIQV
jgi:hypothetical protein